MVHSLLENVKRSDICHDPYPHLVIRNCLPQAYYEALSEEYPSPDLILSLNEWRSPQGVEQNQRQDICAHKALHSRHLLSQRWIDFVEHHTSPAFFGEAVALLGPEIREIYPSLEKRLGKRLEDASTGVRFDPQSDTGEISLDCQVGINTPVTRESSVRGVHLDAPEELFAMLLYFRPEQDDSSGGDLDIYRWKRPSRSLFRGGDFSAADMEYVKTVTYEPNTLVVFINSPFALHAVSERSVTTHSRRLVNVIAEVYRSVPEGLFKKPRLLSSGRRRWLRSAQSLVGKIRKRPGV
jgi:hypothetical protein